MATFEEVFTAIDRDIQQTFARWEIYLQLYDGGDPNLALLNSSGSYVFGVLQRLLLDDTILALSRLTDPASTLGRDNASIKHLVELARPVLEPPVAAEIEASLARLERHVGNARTHRNKAIAHADLQHAVGAAVLPTITYAELEGARQELTALMLKLGRSSIRRVGGYKPIFTFGTDGNALLQALRRARAAESGA